MSAQPILQDDYISHSDLCSRFNCTKRTLHNWQKPRDEKGGRGFPKPAFCSKENMWSMAEVAAWEAKGIQLKREVK